MDAVPPPHLRNDEFFAELYPLLRRIAQQELRASDSIQATSLVHEAFMRVRRNERFRAADTNHMRRVAAKAIRYALLDYRRRKGSLRRGGNTVPLDSTAGGAAQAPVDIDSILDVLEEMDLRFPNLVDAAEQTFLLELSNPEAAKVLSVPESHIATATLYFRKVHAELQSGQ